MWFLISPSIELQFMLSGYTCINVSECMHAWIHPFFADERVTHSHDKVLMFVRANEQNERKEEKIIFHHSAYFGLN